MNLKLLFHTLRHLRLRQICYQVRYRLLKPKFVEHRITADVVRCDVVEWVEKYCCCDGKRLNFLNISDDFRGWSDTSKGMLWAYNVNYMDWLNQPNMTYDEGARWIDGFIDELPSNCVGQDPYPIALRMINWVKFITKHWECTPVEKRTLWRNSIYAQYQLLHKKLEYHLLANHMLEDVFALFIGAIFFADAKMYKHSVKLLKQELNEQILRDGMHYEQSVMYHLILLDRLLDCYNFASNNVRFEGQQSVNDFLLKKAELMLGHLEAIRYADDSFPMCNDAALGIAPTITDVFEYAKRLNICWQRVGLSDSGYRRMANSWFEATVDVGNIMSAYQPGHTHADSLNYELRIDGEPFIVDTGISTYNKTARRQYERSSMAHNVVVIDGRDSSEVWGGFRVGSRAKVKLHEDAPSRVVASHDGYGAMVQRGFELCDNQFVVADVVASSAEAISYIHFASNINPVVEHNRLITPQANIEVEGATAIEIFDETISTEYNIFHPIKVVKIRFNSNLKYKIQKNENIIFN